MEEMQTEVISAAQTSVWRIRKRRKKRKVKTGMFPWVDACF